MAKLQSRKVGDDCLRKVCRPVDAITPRVLTLLDDMVDTMRAANGVGLAAPQVGILRRIVLMFEDNIEVHILPTGIELRGLRRSVARVGYQLKAYIHNSRFEEQ